VTKGDDRRNPLFVQVVTDSTGPKTSIGSGWATENTLQHLANSSDTTASAALAMLDKLGGNVDDAKRFYAEFKASQERLVQSTDNTGDTGKKSKSLLEKLGLSQNTGSTSIKEAVYDLKYELKRGMSGMIGSIKAGDPATMIESVGSLLGAGLEKVLKIIPGIGRVIGAAASTAVAVAFYTPIRAMKITEMYQTMSDSGITFGGSMNSMARAAMDAGLSIETMSAEMTKFSGVASMLGNKRMVELGTRFGQLTHDGADLNMGYLEAREAVFTYADTLRSTGRLAGKSLDEVALETRVYYDELSKIAAITGQSRKQMADQQKEFAKSAETQALLAQLPADMRESFANSVSGMEPLLKDAMLRVRMGGVTRGRSLAGSEQAGQLQSLIGNARPDLLARIQDPRASMQDVTEAIRDLAPYLEPLAAISASAPNSPILKLVSQLYAAGLTIARGPGEPQGPGDPTTRTLQEEKAALEKGMRTLQTALDMEVLKIAPEILSKMSGLLATVTPELISVLRVGGDSLLAAIKGIESATEWLKNNLPSWKEMKESLISVGESISRWATILKDEALPAFERMNKFIKEEVPGGWGTAIAAALIAPALLVSLSSSLVSALGKAGITILTEGIPLLWRGGSALVTALGEAVGGAFASTAVRTALGSAFGLAADLAFPAAILLGVGAMLYRYRNTPEGRAAFQADEARRQEYKNEVRRSENKDETYDQYSMSVDQLKELKSDPKMAEMYAQAFGMRTSGSDKETSSYKRFLAWLAEQDISRGVGPPPGLAPSVPTTAAPDPAARAREVEELRQALQQSMLATAAIPDRMSPEEYYHKSAEMLRDAVSLLVDLNEKTDKLIGISDTDDVVRAILKSNHYIHR